MLILGRIIPYPTFETKRDLRFFHKSQIWRCSHTALTELPDDVVAPGKRHVLAAARSSISEVASFSSSLEFYVFMV